ncbi:MAG: methyl-accepting chemotaxis protein [Candidatus Endobugula sp.]|jgi:methyl-accepting chemotaxis protein
MKTDILIKKTFNWHESIFFKFNALCVVIIFAAIGAVSVFDYSSAKKEKMLEMEQQTNTALIRLSIGLPPALWNFDITQLKQILESEKNNIFLLGIEVTDGKKTVVASKKDIDNEYVFVTNLDIDGLVKETDLIYSDDGETNTIGRVKIIYSDAPIIAKLHRIFVTGLFKCVMVTLFVSILLTLILHYMIAKPIKRINSVLHKISLDDNLTHKLPQYSGEIGSLVEVIEHVIANICELVQQIVKSSQDVGGSLGQVSNISQNSRSGFIQQREVSHQLVNSIDEMNKITDSMVACALDVDERAGNADIGAASAQDALLLTVQSIDHLAEDISKGADVMNDLQLNVGNITSVLDVIRGIAEQTNLLALNAAIEAARAGEQGRGFAVVADEVRTLASRTQDSTQEIQSMTEALQAGAHKAAQVMAAGNESSNQTVQKATSAQSAIDEITLAVKDVHGMITQIANAAKDQSLANKKISKSIEKIVVIADNSEKSSNQIDEALVSVNQLYQDLGNKVSKFTI